MKNTKNNFALSLPQQDIYLDQQYHDSSPLYNVGGYIESKGIDVDRMKSVHALIVQQDDSFGIRIGQDNDGPYQYLSDERNQELPLVDFSLDNNPSASAKAWVKELFETPIDYLHTQLCQAWLLKLDCDIFWYVGFAHHLAMDGWGFSNWAKKLSRYYNARQLEPVEQARGEWLKVVDKDLSYLGGKLYRADKAYWQSEGRLSQTFDLPAYYASRFGGKQSFPSRRYTLKIPRALFCQIEQLADKFKVGVAQIFLGVISTYFSSAYNKTQLTIGIPTHNRRNFNEKNMLGAFTSLSPLTVSVDQSDDFANLVRNIAKLQKKQFKHQRYPISHLAKDLSLPGKYLYSVMFNYLKLDYRELSFGHHNAEVVYVSHNHQQTPLSITIWDGDATDIEMQLDHNLAYFSDREIALIASRLEHLLVQVCTDNQLPLTELDWLPPEERQALLPNCNKVGIETDTILPIHQQFEQQVEQSAEAIALICDGQHLTYAVLNGRVNQLAHYLKEQIGIVPDTLVGVCLDHSVEMVVAVLAILKAGGAYVPLDPNYPSARLEFMLKDAELDIVLTCQTLVTKLVSSQAQIVCLDKQDMRDQLAALPTENLLLATSPFQLAYVIYTSGSTGQPKGVMIEHASLTNFVMGMKQQPGCDKADRVLAMSSLSFDIHVLELYLPLLCGASLCLATSKEPDKLVKLIEEQAITIIQATPATWKMLLDSQWQPQQALKLLCGGEALPLTLKDALLAYPNIELWNMYGPTETCVWATVSQMTLDSEVSLGSCIANVELYIVTDEMKLAPTGVAGELCIGGAGLARGYLNRPKLNTEKYIANPFYDESVANGSKRLYKTGDLARITADGQLVHLGRIDNQVKVRGFRIELEEIELAFMLHARVKDAVVVAALGPKDDCQLVAHIVATDSDTDNQNQFIHDLKQSLRARLPDYMIPAFIMFRDALPLTPNGKVDRKSLPVPKQSLLQKEYEPPQSNTEQLLCAIWQDVLPVERIGVRDNFFELGGHSLLLVQVISRLQEQGIEVSARQLLAAEDLAELAGFIDQCTSAETPLFKAPDNLIPHNCQHITPEMLPLVTLSQQEIDALVRQVPHGSQNVQDIYPLGPLQQGILFRHITNPARDPYILSSLFKVKDEQAARDFVIALESMVARHDVLRTAFFWEGISTPIQLVQGEAKLQVSQIDISDQANGLQFMSERGRSRQLAMNLNQAPLLNVELAAKPESDERYILLQYHHIISDHVGLNILLKEIALHQQGLAASLVTPHPYREFIAHSIHQSKQQDARAYFEHLLSDVIEPTAAFNIVDAQRDCSDMEELTTLLPKPLNRQIRELATELKLAPAALFHAAWALVLAQCCGRNDVVFGTVLSGRLQGTYRAEEILGVFINTLPLRIDFSGQSVTDLVLLAQSRLLDLLAYEQTPLSLAQQCSGLSNDTPLFSSVLNYRHSDTSEQAMFAKTGDTVAEYLSSYSRGDYPLMLAVDDFDNAFSLDIKADSRISAKRICEYMCTALAGLTDALNNAPKHLASQLSVLPKSERQRLLNDWNDTQVDCANMCIHQLFEQKVSHNGDAIALVFGSEQLTYDELNKRANQLAHYLVSKYKIEPDTLVGICIERSVEMIVAILAIFKTGGAYVPLDPDYPSARLEYMLEDAELHLVLTQHAVIERTPLSKAQSVCLDNQDICTQLANQPTHNLPLNRLTAEHLAYVIYTSGTTGQPKGVMLQHLGLCNLAKEQQKNLNITAQSKVLQFASVAFDAAIFELVGCLGAGARLVLIPETAVKNAALLEQQIKEQGVTHATLPPALLPRLTLSSWQNVTNLVIAGESCPTSLADLWAKNRRLINAYGPSETTVCATMGEYQFGQEHLHIGRPLGNTQVYVVSDNLTLAPLGVAGELCVGGLGLARGYLRRETLTAEKFIKNPFYDASNIHCSENLYRTGDLVRWLPDGNLEFLGRIDHQVKIRGFRVELGEVEQVLTRQKQVKDAVVIAEQGQHGDKQLIAYIATDNLNDSTFVEQLKQELKAQLPRYMLPAVIIPLAVLPLTTNGKVDRKALPRPDISGLKARYVAPETETERLLCEIWQDVLSVEQVGCRDNFFALGGHSLLLMEVISQLQQVGIDLSVEQLFVAENLADLAATIEQSEKSLSYKAPANLITETCSHITPNMLPLVTLTQEEIDVIAQKIPGGAANIQDIYPLGPLQQGILFHHISNPAADPYTITSSFKVKGEQAVNDFVTALHSMVDRHDVLRTAVVHKGLSVMVQVVQRRAKLAVNWLEIDEKIHDVEHIITLCQAEHSPMDLIKAPLLAVQVARVPKTDQHIISLQYHHIIIDHVGLEIIRKEIALHMQGLTERLPPPVPYREFISHTQYQAEQYDTNAYFEQLLAGVDEPTALFNLLDVQGDGSNITEMAEPVPTQLNQKIRDVARDLKLTPAALFHAAWSIVVSACSGRTDLVFGTVLSGRLQGTGGAQEMLGVFINTLPFRVRLQQLSVSELVRQVQDELVNMLPFEQVPLAQAQQCSALPNGTPLFSALLNYRHSAANDAASSQAMFSRPDDDQSARVEYLGTKERANYPLVLAVDDFRDAFSIDVKVDSQISAKRVIDYMLTALGRLVEALENAPQTSVTDLTVIPAEEQKKLLDDWSTNTSLIAENCVHRLFEEYAAKTPDAVALVYRHESLTYGELNQRANQLADYLKNEKHLTPDTLVGICIERSFDMFVGILAILKAGGAYVPLDPDYPASRIEYMLDDAALTLVLTEQSVLARTPLNPDLSVCLDSPQLASILANRPSSNLAVNTLALTPSHLAYVIYTSGSTGRPKGVMVEHKSLVNVLSGLKTKFAISPSDNFAYMASVAFDIALFESFLTLISGGRTTIIDRRTILDGQLLAQALAECTLLHAVPNLMREITLYKQQDPSCYTQLRRLFVGGDKVSANLLREMTKAFVGCDIVELYGPTECTILSTSLDITDDALSHSGAVIGKALANTRLYVLNDDGRPVPIQVTGELHIGGAGVARGYLNKADLSAEKFVANPFDTKNHTDRLYRTGDLVRWLPDGNLEFLGRVDDQVKIRGYRIELGEIEHALMGHEQVKEAIVIARESDGGNKQLVAYIVPVGQIDGHDLTAELKQRLQSTLPEYMVPTALIQLDELPLTANGKVDQKALPELDIAQVQSEYVAPRTDTESMLCAIWQDVLGVERIGVTDNFFELGGHSLLMVQVISELQQRGIELSVQDLFAATTLAELAQSIDSEVDTPVVSFTAPDNLIPTDCNYITPDMLPMVVLSAGEIEEITNQIPGGASNIQDVYPLGPLQEGILFHHLMEPQADPYILSTLFKVDGAQVVNGFLEALDFLVSRHDVLRTVVLWDGLSVPVQVVQRNAKLAVHWLDILDADDGLRVMQTIAENTNNGMDLTRAPLITVRIAPVPDSEQHYLLLQYHHIISDHVGLNIIQNEIDLFLRKGVQAFSKPIPYREFIAHIVSQAQNHDAKSYFERMLADVEEPTVPFNLLNVQGNGSNITQLSRSVPLKLNLQLRELAKAMKISPAALFHAAWAKVIADCSGRDDVVFGTVVSGRLQGMVGAENMLGVFINTLPFRVKLKGHSVIELVEQVHQALHDILPYEQTSLAQAQQCSALPNGTPLFSALLNYKHAGENEQDSDHNGGMQILHAYESTNYPLDLGVKDTQRGFSLDLRVDSSVDAERFINYMLSALENLVNALQNQASQPAMQLSVIPEDERQLLLTELNDTESEIHSDYCIHELFEQQVVQTPEALALVCGTEQVTYGELNRRANQLAHYLAEHRNVGPETIVGVCLERSVEMVVAILAILKAGGAYVPLDPSYPEARLSYMLEDANVSTTLTKKSLLAKTSLFDLTAVCLDDSHLQAELANQQITNLPTGQLGVTPESLAYAIYTSGTTGQPKGVLICHYNTTAMLFWAQSTFSSAELSKVLASTSLNFDLSVFELFVPLSFGHQCILVESALSLIEHQPDVSLINTVPSAVKVLLEHEAVPPAVQVINVAGEPLTAQLVNELLGSQSCQKVFNLYGPSEDTTYSTYAAFEQPLDKAPSIGSAVSNTMALVLSSKQALLPFGAVGELYLTGAGVARGYLNQEALTEARFIQNPFYDESKTNSSKRLYRTGDLVRWLPNGQLDFLGRVDNQVKIRGFRIELSEIEHALLAYGPIKDAIVIARENPQADKQLVAYIVPGKNENRQGLMTAIKRELQSKLPDYMVPSATVVLDSLPLTANGKIDRLALPDADISRLQTEYVAPSGLIEQTLCDIWQRVLQVERVGVTDNFFDLGGNSLLTTRLLIDINKTFEINLTMKQVFTTQTVAELSPLIEIEKTLMNGITAIRDNHKEDRSEEAVWEI